MSEYFSMLVPPARANKDEVRRLARHGCLDIHRVDWLRCYLAADGLRMLCEYRAVDAESVRLVLRHQGFAGVVVHPAKLDELSTQQSASHSRVVVQLQLESPDAEGRNATKLAAIAAVRNSQFPVTTVLESSIHGSLLLVLDTDSDSEVRACLRSAHIDSVDVWRCTELDPRPEAVFDEIVPGNSATDQSAELRPASSAADTDFDVAIIGAGLSGITAVQRFTSMGLRVRVYESASDVGGVWHWNRYPGARVDSETHTYAFAFSDELVDDWDWQELFGGQPELEQYFQHVVDRFDLRKHMQFNTKVTAARYEPDGSRWMIETDVGDRVSARFLVVASGTLSTPQLPDYPGIDSFAGPSFHTASWPATGLDLADKHVGVIGTGSSGVQVIRAIASQVKQLTVFQRTPTYCVPRRNHHLTDEERQHIRENWSAILAACRRSYSGFVHTFDERSGLAVTAAEREDLFEQLWQTPGFAFWFGNFADLMMNHEVNAFACEFVRRKIRERVVDPEVARKLMPDHPFGTKRVPLEDGYYEVYNRDNVQLVDLRATPIEAITPAGIRTAGRDYELDVITYATGFDVGTGAFNRLDLRGEDDVSIKDKWIDGPKTFLGLMVSGFPNMFMVNGPQNASGLCNAARCIEQNVDWIARAVGYLRANNRTQIAASEDAETRWTEHVEDAAAGTVLAANTNSWYYGANTPGKPRRITIYAPGASRFRERCEEVADRSFAGCVIS